MGMGTQDIASELRNGSASRFFDIEATTTTDYDTKEGSTLMLHLTKLSPAVTNETELLFHPSWTFDRDAVNDVAILGSNTYDDDEDNSHGFAVLSVNMKSGKARGLHRDQNGNFRQLSSPGIDTDESVKKQHLPLHARQLTRRTNERKFTCGAKHEPDDEHIHTSTNLFPQSRTNLRTAPTKAAALLGDDDRRLTVRLVIAVDIDFIKLHGDVASAIEYITWLVTTISAILESEIGARLQVAKILQTDIFESVDTLDGGLNVMREHFQGMVGERNDLVHAMLGRHIGGGIAYVSEYFWTFSQLHQFLIRPLTMSNISCRRCL